MAKTVEPNFKRVTRTVQISDGIGGTIECAVQVFEPAEHVVKRLELDPVPTFGTRKELSEFIKERSGGFRALERAHNVIEKNLERIISNTEEIIEKHGEDNPQARDRVVAVVEDLKKILEDIQ